MVALSRMTLLPRISLIIVLDSICCSACRLLDASALLDDAFAGTLSDNSFEWESALRLAEAASQSPASKTGEVPTVEDNQKG